MSNKMGFSWNPWKNLLSVAVVCALFLCAEIRGQNYEFPSDFGQTGFQSDSNFGGQRAFGPQVRDDRVFRGQQQQQQPQRPGSNNGNVPNDLQSQFTDIFDWNRDLTGDPRFTSCTVPDINSVSQSCPKRALYYGMNPDHRRAVRMVKQILTGSNTPAQTLCLAGAMRDDPGINPNVWVRGLLGAHTSNDILFNLDIPPLVEIMPSIFINTDAIETAKRQGPLSPQRRQCTVIDGKAGQDNGIENRLWYWREDILVNSFHLNWHLTYPFQGEPTRADRRGELFYFSHHSHLARYHAERLANGLGAITPLFIGPNVPVPEPYNPHLNDSNSGQRWTPRRPFSVLQDTSFTAIEGVPPNVSLADRALHVQRVEQSIYEMQLRGTNGQRTPLDSVRGIDILGDVIEASMYSSNPDYYGRFGLHNEGHVLLSLIEDPQNRTGLPPGVMVEVATAMRDPAFYTYHASMDATFDNHKRTLRPYLPQGGELPLYWPGAQIQDLYIISDDGDDYDSLQTYFTQRTFDLSRGLDFNRSGVDGPIQACATHLDHVGFQYKIHVNSQFPSNTATIRIFLAPRYDEYGRRYTIIEQRNLFFMMDLFTYDLDVGENEITRRSTQSALTISIPQGLQEIQVERKYRQRYCGCGWPHHLLVPKGTERGMIFDLFVMLTDGKQDAVPSQRSYNSNANNETCNPAPIYCGRLRDTYPDSRPMGYPFDRLPYVYNAKDKDKKTHYGLYLEDFLGHIPNMAATQIKITHVRNQPAIRNRQPGSRQGQRQRNQGSNRNYNSNPSSTVRNQQGYNAGQTQTARPVGDRQPLYEAGSHSHSSEESEYHEDDHDEHTDTGIPQGRSVGTIGGGTSQFYFSGPFNQGQQSWSAGKLVNVNPQGQTQYELFSFSQNNNNNPTATAQVPSIPNVNVNTNNQIPSQRQYSSFPFSFNQFTTNVRHPGESTSFINNNYQDKSPIGSSSGNFYPSSPLFTYSYSSGGVNAQPPGERQASFSLEQSHYK